MIALDISGPMLQQLVAARQRLPVWAVRGSAQALRFRDASVRVVACGFGLVHFPDLAAALAEFRRVVWPGGLLGLSWFLYEDHTPATGAALRAPGRGRDQRDERVSGA